MHFRGYVSELLNVYPFTELEICQHFLTSEIIKFLFRKKRVDRLPNIISEDVGMMLFVILPPLTNVRPLIYPNRGRHNEW